MAKKSKIAAQKKREKLVAQYAERRAELKAIIKSPTASLDERMEASRKLSTLPRDSSPVRLRNRDQVDGRPRGYVGKAGVSRIRFREMAHGGELPGVPKRKKSRSTTRHRRAQWKTTPTQLVEIRVEGKVLRVPRNLVKAYHSGLIDAED